MRVRLYELYQLALIIAHPSGVTYSNQAGGHACAQPELEGILVPLGNDPPLLEPEADITRRLSVILENAMWLDEALANAVDEALARHPDTAIARVDRARLRESMEAWVHVVIWIDPNGDLPPLISGVGHARGVLTWRNSD